MTHRDGAKPQETGVTLDDLRALPPTLDLPEAGRLLGIGRTVAYQLARRGEFPVRVLRLGNRCKVPTADLLALLGVDREAA